MSIALRGASSTSERIRDQEPDDTSRASIAPPGTDTAPDPAPRKAGKRFDLPVGPDMGHSAISNERMMEFFIENLVMKRGDS
jgi:hypothetical protein